MKPHKYYLPTILSKDLIDEDPLKEFLNTAFRWSGDQKGRDYWDNIYFGVTPITITDINYINEKYGEWNPSFGNRLKKIKDILEQEYIFLVKDLEIL